METKETKEALRRLIEAAIDFDLIISHKGLSNELSKALYEVLESNGQKDDALKKKHWAALMAFPRPALKAKHTKDGAFDEPAFESEKKALCVPQLYRIMARELFNETNEDQRQKLLYLL